MAKYPQIHVVGKYQDFLIYLAGVGKPAMVDQGYIRKLGYKSSYDANFLHAIKFIGLVEDKRNGAPTEHWSRLRSDFEGTLADGLRRGYADLFSFYPDAHLRDEEALTNYFRGNTDDDADGVSRMANAFIAVRDLASFDDSIPLPDSDSDSHDTDDGDSVSPEFEKKIKTTPGEKVKESGSTQVNLNIQLQLPADATGEIYEKFFEAMKKHGLI